MLEIAPAQAGQRLDNFLLKQLKNVPKSHIYRLLRSGQVRVNSGRKKPTYRIQAGDRLRIPPVRSQATAAGAAPPAVLQRLQAAILHEDDDLLVINKPAGLAVHGGSGLAFGVIEAFRQLRPGCPLELIHRLDRETSGILVMSKNRAAMNAVQQLFQGDSRDTGLEKTYTALLCGHWPPGRRRIDAPLGKRTVGGEHRMGVDADGQRAVSHFELIETLPEASLMRIRIETGRTHQIRVHAAHTGHPVAGDSKYGQRDANRRFRQLGLKRLFLHASALYLPAPFGQHLRAPLGEDLEAPLQALKDQKVKP